MAMDPDSGSLREIYNEIQKQPNEVLFRTGEVVEIKGCYFKIDNIFKDHLSLVGISKEDGLKSKLDNFKRFIPKDEANVF